MRAGLQITTLAALREPRTCDLRNSGPTHCLCGHSGYKIYSYIINLEPLSFIIKYRWRRQTERCEVGTLERSLKCLTITRACLPQRSLFPNAVDELPNEPNLTTIIHKCFPILMSEIFKHMNVSRHYSMSRSAYRLNV